MVRFFDRRQPASCASVLQQSELPSFKHVGFLKDGDSSCRWSNCGFVQWTFCEAGGFNDELLVVRVERGPLLTIAQ